MGSITADLHDRLMANLPGIPVLRPHELREVLEAAQKDAQGRPMVGGGIRGLPAFLEQHPDGYVQIEQPLPITSDGTVSVYWVAIACLHLTEFGAIVLAEQVRHVLNGTPVEPGPCREITPAEPEFLQGAWLCRSTFEVLAIDGQTVQ